MRKFYLIAFALLVISTCPQSATFSVLCDSPMEKASESCSIKMSGEIVAGDEARLRKTLQEPLRNGLIYRQLLLESPGGDVYEALKLAKLVREAMLETRNYRLMPLALGSASALKQPANVWACVSACFLVWVAGTDRMSVNITPTRGYHVGIGLHRVYMSPESYRQSPGKVAELQQNVTALVREYLRREQVPERFIDQMIMRSSQEVFWLSDTDENLSLDGRAPWFEEMMIARCGLNPQYVRQNERNPRPEYLSWRQKYNSCEYNVRREAQSQLGRR